jgi:hypothetical protein
VSIVGNVTTLTLNANMELTYSVTVYMFIDFMGFTFHASNVQKNYIKMRCRFLFLTFTCPTVAAATFRTTFTFI